MSVYRSSENSLNTVCRGSYPGGVHECKFGRVEEPRWIWYRPNSQNNPRLPELHAKNMYEHILVFNRGEGRLLRPCPNVLAYEAEYGSRIHAMQKPVEMLKDLISRFTLQGESVCDPCYGSGATLKAAAQLARDFWGGELNPAMREPAMGWVSQDFEGVAPRAERFESPVGFSDADADEMEDLEFEPTAD